MSRKFGSRNYSSRVAALRLGVSAAAIVLAMGAAGAASAADAPPSNEVEAVVVTGFRTSLEKAINIKKTDTVATDSILAEDIGKFPDLNLSESIQRIPGVALARDAGEGRQISVRGLGPQFTRVRIDGLEALTTAGGTDAAGGTNRGRSFDFNIFASDLFNSITVQKTAQASTEEGSLGATVDLRTARPFDYNGFTLTASGQASHNDLAGDTSPRGAFLISNTWGGGTFGALLSVAYTKRNLIEEGTSTVRWAKGSAFGSGFQSAPAGFTLAQINDAYHPRFPRFDEYTDKQERLGATLSLQWAPSDKLLFTFDALYADFKGTREEQFLEAPSFSTSGASGIGDTNVTSAVIDGNNTLIKGTFDDVDLRVEDRFDRLDTKFTQYALNGSWDITDNLKLVGLIGTSKSDHNNPVQTTLTFDQVNVDGYSYDYSQGRVPLITYGTANLNSPTAWVLSQIRLRPQTALNTYDTVSGDLTWTLGDTWTLSGGLALKSYDFETTERRRTNGTTTNQEPVIPAGVAGIPIASYSRTLHFRGEGLGLPAGNVNAWLVPNLSVAQTLLQLNSQTAFGGAFRLGPEPALGNNRSVQEDDTTGYVQADFRTEIAGMAFRGNFGVRSVKTEQSATGYTFVSGSPVKVTVDREYTDTLPSLNLVLGLTDTLQLRFSAAKTMSRPDLGSLTPGSTVSVSGATRTVTVGNPNLEPFRANAYDFAAEWYFNKGGLLSVALFKKDVDSFVQTVQTIGPFTGNAFGLPDSIATAACGATVGCNASVDWRFTAPVNTSGGTIKGYEINYQQALRFLPHPLDNLGLLINYTHVESQIDYINSSGVVVATNDITGLSRESYNATVYYEDDRWSARVSAAYRSKYLTRVPGQETGTDVDGTNKTFNVDASLSYTLNDNFKLSIEGVNLTDEFQDQFNDSANRVSFYHHTGREILFGLRYTY